MVQQKNGNKLRRHIAVALLPTAALLLGPDATFASNSLDRKGPGIHAIGGTGTDAIGGTGRTKGRAIGGTGTDAIGGTGVMADAIGGTGRDQVVLLGPIDSVDQASGTISILGRKFQLPSGEFGSRIFNLYAGGSSLQVAVLEGLSKAGEISNLRLQVHPAPYVPGVSEIVMKGNVQSVDLSKGLAVVNGIAVDFTDLLETRASGIRVGDMVTVRGIMPQSGESISASVLVIHGR